MRPFGVWRLAVPVETQRRGRHPIPVGAWCTAHGDGGRRYVYSIRGEVVRKVSAGRAVLRSSEPVEASIREGRGRV